MGGAVNIGDVMDEVADRLGAITGLRAYAWPAGTVSPPAAVVNYPESITPTSTYGAGMATMQLVVYILVGQPNDRATRDAASVFSAGSGTGSVKAALEATGWTSCDVMTVGPMEFGTVTVAGVDYLAIQVTVDVVGSGA